MSQTLYPMDPDSELRNLMRTWTEFKRDFEVRATCGCVIRRCSCWQSHVLYLLVILCMSRCCCGRSGQLCFHHGVVGCVATAVQCCDRCGWTTRPRCCGRWTRIGGPGRRAPRVPAMAPAAPPAPPTSRRRHSALVRVSPSRGPTGASSTAHHRAVPPWASRSVVGICPCLMCKWAGLVPGLAAHRIGYAPRRLGAARHSRHSGQHGGRPQAGDQGQPHVQVLLLPQGRLLPVQPFAKAQLMPCRWRSDSRTHGAAAPCATDFRATVSLVE